MKRLTAHEIIAGLVHDIPVFEMQDCAGVEEIIKRLADIEDILGDEYELDRLRELVEADRTIGREICLPNDNVRGTVEGFQSWKDGGISFMLVDGRHRYSMSSDLVYKFLVGREQDG